METVIPELDQLTTWQTLKGLGFVFVTTLLIYYLLRQELLRHDQTEVALEESRRRLSTLMANLPGMAYRFPKMTGIGRWNLLAKDVPP